MTLAAFLLALGAAARLVRLITRDAITERYRALLRRAFGDDGLIAYLTTCPWCMSMYVAPITMALAWYVGQHPGFVIPAAALTASHLIGLAAAHLDGE